MQVILMERVSNLGQMGDVVRVKDGYARNFLLPTGKAKRASSENIAHFENEKAQLEARNLETRKEAEALGAKINGQKFVIIRSASDVGALYGSVTSRDIAQALTEGGFSIDRRQVVLSRPIKELGLHNIHINLHPEVDGQIYANVARSLDEAELQASGKSVQELAAEKEAEADVEISKLFDNIGAAAADDGELVESLNAENVAEQKDDMSENLTPSEEEKS